MYSIINISKALQAIIIISISLLLLTSCRTTENRNEQVKMIQRIEPTPLNFIGYWLDEGVKEKLVRNVTREYEFKNQHVDINLKFPEEIYFDRNNAGSNQNFVAKICKEKSPEWDIIMINNDYSNINNAMEDKDWAKKYLVDFSTIPEFRQNTLPQLLTDSVKALWGGIIPGPFVEGVNYALWINAAVAKKIGIEVKQIDMTFDEFLGYVKAVDDYNKRTSSNIITIYDAKYWKTAPAIAQQLYISALDNPSEIFNDTVSETKLLAWHKTLKSFEKLAQYKPLLERNSIDIWDQGEMLANEECLFFSNGSWMYSIWDQTHPEKIKNFIPTEFPTFKTCSYYIGQYQITWAVLKNAPHREEAIDFLLAWNTPDVAQKWVELTKSPSGTIARFIESSFGQDQFEIYTNHINKRYGTNKLPLTINSTYILGKSKGYFPNYFEEVIRGELSADDAMEKLKASINN